MTVNEFILRFPKLKFLKYSPGFQALSRERQEYVLQLLEDAMFWIELDEKPNNNDGFKFLAASYGLDKAQHEASEKSLAGKEREKFLKPHQDLYTMFNPYSGNSNDKK